MYICIYNIYIYTYICIPYAGSDSEASQLGESINYRSKHRSKERCPSWQSKKLPRCMLVACVIMYRKQILQIHTNPSLEVCTSIYTSKYQGSRTKSPRVLPSGKRSSSWPHSAWGLLHQCIARLQSCKENTLPGRQRFRWWRPSLSKMLPSWRPERVLREDFGLKKGLRQS